MEDSRALGHCRTLGLPELMGVRPAPTAALMPRRGPWQLRRAATRLLQPYRADETLPARVGGLIERELDSGFVSLLGLDLKLDRHVESMTRFLKALP
jgi:hypothetical protein